MATFDPNDPLRVKTSERTRLAVAGAHAVTKSQLTDQPNKDKILGRIFGGLLFLALAVALAGLAALIIEINIANLAGVPSIIYGILGLAFIVRGPIDLGFILVAGSMTLALLVLPTVILASREAIRAVPPSIREGSLALGAPPWQTIRRQVLPASIPGMATGVILAISRALGETAPLLLVGATTFVTFDPQPFSTDGYSALPVLIFEYAKQPQAEFRELAAAGVIVMLIVLLAMNSFAVWLRNRYEQSW